MKINFIGSTTVGMTGEKADEVLLVEELRKQGQEVNFIPRDIWKAYVDGEWNDDWKRYLDDLNSDINIICKWYAFDKGIYIDKLKKESGSKVLYWVWDWMDGFPHGHKDMVMASDLYIANDVMHNQYKFIPHAYYFPFDVADGNIFTQEEEKVYDVTFFGSFLHQGLRKDWIPEIAKSCRLKIFSSNYQEWTKLGLDADPAVWGDDFATKVAQSKICLQFSVDDNTWGYWSNRVGKILTQGGFLLAHYAPGMELFLRDGVEYFKTIDECKQKINYYLEHEDERVKIADKGYDISARFTVEARIKDLLILIGNL
jgi:hypothetical protein